MTSRAGGRCQRARSGDRGPRATSTEGELSPDRECRDERGEQAHGQCHVTVHRQRERDGHERCAGRPHERREQSAECGAENRLGGLRRRAGRDHVGEGWSGPGPDRQDGTPEDPGDRVYDRRTGEHSPRSVIRIDRTGQDDQPGGSHDRCNSEPHIDQGPRKAVRPDQRQVLVARHSPDAKHGRIEQQHSASDRTKHEKYPGRSESLTHRSRPEIVPRRARAPWRSTFRNAPGASDRSNVGKGRLPFVGQRGGRHHAPRSASAPT